MDDKQATPASVWQNIIHFRREKRLPIISIPT